MSPCPHCGLNPVPHLPTFFGETVAVLLEPVDHLLTHSFLGRFFRMLARGIESFLHSFFFFTGIMTYGDEPSLSTSSRGRVLWDEAIRRGIPMRSYRAFGKETDTFEYFMKGKWRRFASLPKPVDPSLSSWADDKILLKRALVRAGIPVPRGESFFFLASALRFARTLSFPVILKPRLGSRGRHTTTMIQTMEELVSAFHRAKQLCGWVVLEEHLTGPVYRATVVDGKVVGVLGGTPPRITGDGISSIRDLIARKNETRPDGVGVYPITPLTDVFLLRQGLTVDSVLQKDRTIDLTEKIGVRVGGTSFEATDTHPAIISVMEAAARVVGDPLIGFDFIIDRLDEDPSGKRWGIIECNTMPFINLHHDPLYGPSNNVAGKVWDLMERRV